MKQRTFKTLQSEEAKNPQLIAKPFLHMMIFLAVMAHGSYRFGSALKIKIRQIVYFSIGYGGGGGGGGGGAEETYVSQCQGL